MLSTDLADLKAYMADNPGAVIEDIAREPQGHPARCDRGAAAVHGAHGRQ